MIQVHLTNRVRLKTRLYGILLQIIDAHYKKTTKR